MKMKEESCWEEDSKDTNRCTEPLLEYFKKTIMALLTLTIAVLQGMPRIRAKLAALATPLTIYIFSTPAR